MDYSLLQTFAWKHIFKLCLCTFVVKSNYAMKSKDFVAKKLEIWLKHGTEFGTCYFDQRFNCIRQQECVEFWWKSIVVNIKIRQYYIFL
jgi:hypothetical protein